MYFFFFGDDSDCSLRSRNGCKFIVICRSVWTFDISKMIAITLCLLYVDTIVLYIVYNILNRNDSYCAYSSKLIDFDKCNSSLLVIIHWEGHCSAFHIHCLPSNCYCSCFCLSAWFLMVKYFESSFQSFGFFWPQNYNFAHWNAFYIRKCIWFLILAFNFFLFVVHLSMCRSFSISIKFGSCFFFTPFEPLNDANGAGCQLSNIYTLHQLFKLD